MKIRSGCPRDCYGGCSVILTVENDRIVNIEGDPLNKATQGYICLKGKLYLEKNYGDKRLKFPLKKVGERGEGRFVRVSWEEAIEEISKKIDYYQNISPKSIMFYKGSGEIGIFSKCAFGFWNQLKGYTTTYGDLCFSAGLEGVIQTYGKAIHNAPWDLENAKCIVLWGKNSAETNFQEMLFIKKAKNNGAKVIVIDPVKTKTAKEADYYIQIMPGQDQLLALGLANYLIKNKMIDEGFIDKYTYGFEEFKTYVEKFDLKTVAAICKINEEEITKLAKLIWDNRPLSLICGLGLQRRINGGQTIRAIGLISALVGSVGIEGGGFRYANLSEPKLKWPFLIESPEEVDYVHVSEIGKGIIEKNIRMLFVQSANPVVSNPDSKNIRKALSQLDFIVVIEQYLSDTAKFADYILPAAATFEYYDILKSYWHPYVIFMDKAHDPLEECKHESEIYRMLAKKLKLNLDYIPENNIDNIKKILKASGIEKSLEELKNAPYLPEDYDEVAFRDRKFNTVTGKIQFKSKTMKRWKMSLIPEHIENKRTDYPLMLISYHSYEKINSQYSEIDKIKKLLGAPKAKINPEDARIRNINHGDKIKIFNDMGAIYAYAEVTSDIKEGVISIPFGFLVEEKANVNDIVESLKTDIGNGTAFHDNYVEVIKLD